MKWELYLVMMLNVESVCSLPKARGLVEVSQVAPYVLIIHNAPLVALSLYVCMYVCMHQQSSVSHTPLHAEHNEHISTLTLQFPLL